MADAEKKEGLLKQVIFNPSKSVTYRPIQQKQMAEIQITNNEKTPIIFKWKSTRPGMYKMRPVYGVLNAGNKSNVQLYCKGTAKEQAPTNDRYTCVVAASPSANVNPENVWSNHKYQQKLAQSGKLRKVKLSILYQGVNDAEVQKDEEEEDEKENEKDKVGKMQKKKATKSQMTQPAHAPTTVSPGATTGVATADNKKKPMVVMFTRKEGDSLSGEDDDPTDGPEGAAAAGGGPNDDMKTTRPAGQFNNLKMQNAEGGGGGNDDMRTTRPAGQFNNLKIQNAEGGGGGGNNDDMKTVNPAGNFNNLKVQNAEGGGKANDDMKTTRPAGQFADQKVAHKKK